MDERIKLQLKREAGGICLDNETKQRIWARLASQPSPYSFFGFRILVPAVIVTVLILSSLIQPVFNYVEFERTVIEVENYVSSLENINS